MSPAGRAPEPTSVRLLIALAESVPSPVKAPVQHHSFLIFLPGSMPSCINSFVVNISSVGVDFVCRVRKSRFHPIRTGESYIVPYSAAYRSGVASELSLRQRQNVRNPSVPRIHRPLRAGRQTKGNAGNKIAGTAEGGSLEGSSALTGFGFVLSRCCSACLRLDENDETSYCPSRLRFLR
jgi:hypothetical protein